MQWTSNASFRKNVEEGTIFTLKLSSYNEIKIHKYMGCGDNWFLSFRALSIDSRSLKTTDFEEAVTRAKECIKRELEQLNNFVEPFLNDSSANEFVR